MEHTTLSPIVIVAGDFNMLRTNPMYQVLAKGMCATQQLGASEISIHSALLPLQDVFQSHASSFQTKPLHMTFAGGSILDYIWVSRHLSFQPWMMDDRCAQQRPRDNQYYAWPSMDQPSDHLPIGMTFFLDG
jgi:endonuclease/exonuclease/phosphatase family metal-dependent hydrolase